MFRLCKLLLLSHLLAGTSWGLAVNKRNYLGDAERKTTSVPNNGSENTDHEGGVTQNMNSDLGVLQDSSTQQQVKKIKRSVVGQAISNSLSPVENLLGVRICKAQIVNYVAVPEADGTGVNLRLKIGADASATLPLIGPLVNLGVSLDLLTTVKLEADPHTKLFTVVVGKLAVDPASVSISLLDSPTNLITSALNAVLGLLTNIVSTLLLDIVLPLLQTLLGGLQVICLDELLNKLPQLIGLQVHI